MVPHLMSSPVLQVRLYLQQFYAMFFKRALYSWRNWKVVVAQFLVPLIFTIIALVVARTLPSHENAPQLRLSLSHYGPTRVPVALPVKPGPLAAELADAYTSQLAGQLAQDVNVTGNSHFKYQPRLFCLAKDFLTFCFSLSFSSPDFMNYVLAQAEKEGGSFNERCIVGAAFRGRSSKYAEATAYFNNEGYHTPATALMMVDNALYKLLAGPNASIEMGNYPMPRNPNETAMSKLTE